MKMKVLYPGALTTIQDEGRYGYQQYGITTCGAMDRKSMHLANALVGNVLSEAVLEMTVAGGSFQFDCDTTVAASGADMQPKINQVPVSMNREAHIKAGDILSFGVAVSGCRTYLAVAGGMDIPMVMGSQSTDLKGKIGGFCGRQLKKDDQIPLAGKEIQQKQCEVPYIPCKNAVTVRVVLGPQEDKFTQKGIQDFLSENYHISEQADRMGYRLEGKKIESKNTTDIISDGIIFGSIQVASDGTPIILMADHQTVGGYAKIGTVVEKDLSLIAQLKPGDTLKFQKVTVQDAQKNQ